MDAPTGVVDSLDVSPLGALRAGDVGEVTVSGTPGESFVLEVCHTQVACVLNEYVLDAAGTHGLTLVFIDAGETSVTARFTTGGTSTVLVRVDPAEAPVAPQSIVLTLDPPPATARETGDVTGITVSGLTPGGSFTQTLCTPAACTSTTLSADADGNYTGALDPHDVAGAYTIAIADDTTGATAEDSFDVAAGPATFVLIVEVRSLEGGPLPLTPITVDPIKDEYEDGEHVTLTALAEFSSGGFRHFFAFWDLTTEGGASSGSSSALNLPVDMVGNTTATAWYESTPEA